MNAQDTPDLEAVMRTTFAKNKNLPYDDCIREIMRAPLHYLDGINYPYTDEITILSPEHCR